MGIYRNMLRTIRQVPDEADKKYLRDWARDEFKRNKGATDQVGMCYFPITEPGPLKVPSQVCLYK